MAGRVVYRHFGRRAVLYWNEGSAFIRRSEKDMRENKASLSGLLKRKVSRKKFLEFSGTAGLGALLGTALLEQSDLIIAAAAPDGVGGTGYGLNKPENIINSVCLQCNTGCSIKVKILDGLAAKIDGNPYSPLTMWPHLSYKTD